MKSSHSLFHSFLFGVLLWLVSPLLWAANLSVVFISPGAENEPYWRSVTRFMQPAARQLGIELEVIYCNRDQIKLTDAMHQLTLRAKKPDYVIISNDRAAAGPMLRMADEAKIKTMLAFSGLVPEQVQEFGLPRQKFPSWIGTISPNSSDGGRLTAEELVRQMQKAQLVSSDGKMHVALIAGDKFTPTGVQRQAGAEQQGEQGHELRLCEHIAEVEDPSVSQRARKYGGIEIGHLGQSERLDTHDQDARHGDATQHIDGHQTAIAHRPWPTEKGNR